MSLFVGNLSNKVTYAQLCHVFEPKGPCVIKPKVRPPRLPISWDFDPFIWVQCRPAPFFGCFQKRGGCWAHTFMVPSPWMKSIYQWSPFHQLLDWGQLNFRETQPLQTPFSILPLHFHILPLHHHASFDDIYVSAQSNCPSIQPRTLTPSSICSEKICFRWLRTWRRCRGSYEGSPT